MSIVLSAVPHILTRTTSQNQTPACPAIHLSPSISETEKLKNRKTKSRKTTTEKQTRQIKEKPSDGGRMGRAKRIQRK